jgi:radical SAM protein with 4Fe4S-binding SPASM domain
MRENIDELEQIVEIAAQNDVDLVTACFVIVTSEAIRASSPTACPERTNAALARAGATAARLGVRTEFPLPLPLEGALPSAVETPVLPPPDAGAGSGAPAPAEPATAEGACGAGSCDSDPGDAPADVPLSGNGPPEDYRGAYYCDMAWRKVFVGVGGEVMPCCSPTRPILGNAFQQPFEAIWNSAEYQRLRRGLYTGELTDYCRKCPYLQQTGALPYARAEGGGRG